MNTITPDIFGLGNGFEIVTLPTWLDNYIFEELEGIYRTQENVDINLNNNEEDNKKYLGTYFPRSWAESYNIFNELLSIPSVFEVINSKSVIKILDIGTGTGGNFLGLLESFKSKGVLLSKKIEIFTLEGNASALNYQKKLTEEFNRINNCYVELVPTQIILTDKTLRKIFEQLKNHNYTFDIVTSFKFISEFYNKRETYQSEKEKKYYKLLLNLVENILDRKGIFVLLDLCSKNFGYVKFREHTPIIMNAEIKEYMQNSQAKLKYVFPISCAYWSHICSVTECYTEVHFHVSHSRKTNDISKVTYNVFAHNSFANEILSAFAQRSAMQVSENQWNPKICRRGVPKIETNAWLYPHAFKRS